MNNLPTPTAFNPTMTSKMLLENVAENEHHWWAESNREQQGLDTAGWSSARGSHCGWSEKHQDIVISDSTREVITSHSMPVSYTTENKWVAVLLHSRRDTNTHKWLDASLYSSQKGKMILWCISFCFHLWNQESSSPWHFSAIQAHWWPLEVMIIWD